MGNKELLQVLRIQLETLAELETIKTFLHLQAKYDLLTRLINQENKNNEQVQTSRTD